MCLPLLGRKQPIIAFLSCLFSLDLNRSLDGVASARDHPLRVAYFVDGSEPNMVSGVLATRMLSPSANISG